MQLNIERFEDEIESPVQPAPLKIIRDANLSYEEQIVQNEQKRIGFLEAWEPVKNDFDAAIIDNTILFSSEVIYGFPLQ